MLNIFQIDLFNEIINSLKEPLSLIHNRIPAFIASVQMWQKSPVIGNGLGSFYNLIFQFCPSDYEIVSRRRAYKHAHNEYLEMLAEGGILSLLTFILIIVALVISFKPEMRVVLKENN